MMFFTIKCPGCGARIELNDSMEFALCEYCGTKIANEKRVSSEKSLIDANRTIENLLKRAENYELCGDYDQARVYFNRVLDMDAGNAEAIAGDRRARGIVDFDNVCVFTNQTHSRTAVYIKVDDSDTIELRNGEKALFSCDVGKHTMLFFTILSSECTIEFVVANAFDEKSIEIEKGIFGLYATVKDV